MIKCISFMLIDSHCHLVHSSYGKEPSEIVKEAKEEGVTKMITIGTSLHENDVAISTANEFPDVYASIGIYPHDERNVSLEVLASGLSAQLASSKKIVGVGECGIDISSWENARPVKEQADLFDMQVAFAVENSLPLIIHNRNGDKEILDVLTHYKGRVRGVVHCFSSSWDTANAFFDLGFMISFSGMITYPSRKELQAIVVKTPMDRLLVETDAPYLPPQGRRGQPNEPKYVKIVAEKVSQLKQLPFEDICIATYKNTSVLFGL